MPRTLRFVLICSAGFPLLRASAEPLSPETVLGWDEATLHHESQRIPPERSASWLAHQDPLVRWAGARLASALPPEQVPWDALVRAAASADPDLSLEASLALWRAARRWSDAPWEAERAEIPPARMRLWQQRLAESARRQHAPIARRWLRYAASSLAALAPPEPEPAPPTPRQ